MHQDVSAWEYFDTIEFLPQRHYNTAGAFWHRDYLGPCTAVWLFQHKDILTPVGKRPSAIMSSSHNVHGAKKYPCNVHRDKMSICWNIPWEQMVQMPKCL